MFTGLLSQDPVVRERAANLVEDQALGEVIHLGDDVPGALAANLFDPSQEVELRAAG